MLATLLPNHNLVKEAFGTAQFETSRKLMTSSDAKDLLSIYDMTVNNCQLLAVIHITQNPSITVTTQEKGRVANYLQILCYKWYKKVN